MNPTCTPHLKRHALFFGCVIACAVWLPSACMANATWSTGFDNAGSVVWYGGPGGMPVPTAGWDPTADATNNPNSGSLRCVEQFTGNGDENFNIPILFLDQSNNPVVLDGSIYAGFSFDFRVAPGVAPATNGDYGWLYVYLVTTTNPFVQGLNGPVLIPLSATNWTNFTMHILHSTPGLEQVCGVQFSMFSSTRWGCYFTNTIEFNVDNLMIWTSCCAPAFTQLESMGTPGTSDYRLRWPGQWAGSSLQFSCDLVTWEDTGLETNAVLMGMVFELALPPSVHPPAASGFWRMRLLSSDSMRRKSACRVLRFFIAFCLVKHERHKAPESQATNDFAAAFVFDDGQGFQTVFTQSSAGDGTRVVDGNRDGIACHEFAEPGFAGGATGAGPQQVSHGNDAIEGLTVVREIKEFIAILDERMPSLPHRGVGFKQWLRDGLHQLAHRSFLEQIEGLRVFL